MAQVTVWHRGAGERCAACIAHPAGAMMHRAALNCRSLAGRRLRTTELSAAGDSWCRVGAIEPSQKSWQLLTSGNSRRATQLPVAAVIATADVPAAATVRPPFVAPNSLFC